MVDATVRAKVETHIRAKGLNGSYDGVKQAIELVCLVVQDGHGGIAVAVFGSTLLGLGAV